MREPLVAFEQLAERGSRRQLSVGMTPLVLLMKSGKPSSFSIAAIMCQMPDGV